MFKSQGSLVEVDSVGSERMSSSEASSTPSRSSGRSSPVPSAVSQQQQQTASMASSGSTGKQTQEPGAPPVYLMSMALNQDHSGLCVATTKDFRKPSIRAY